MAREAFDYPELKLDLLNVDAVGRQFAVLQAAYGDGYADTAFVGTAAGRIKFSLSAAVWPDDINVRQINFKSAFAYYYDFFSDRLRNGNAPFRIYWRGGYYLVQFEKPEISIDVLTGDLFAGGIELVGRRIAGVAVRQDGSLIYPPEHPGLYGWWCADYFTDTLSQPDNSTADEWLARGTAEVFTPVVANAVVRTNQIAGEPALQLFNGYFTTQTQTIYEVALVMKVRAATFPANTTILSALSGGTQFLAASSGATKFTNLGISGYEYRYNGIIKAANDQTAPMNQWGIVQVKRSVGFTATGGLTLGFRGGGTEYAAIDVAEAIAFKSATTSQYSDDLYKYLKAKYKL
jgi:hypothetical protein